MQLTYLKVASLAVWPRFVKFVKKHLSAWKVRYWCATMETCTDGGYHFHLMLQFHSSSDKRRLEQFCFEGLRAGASATDICGEGFCRKKLQQSIDRGFFYVFADKEGTVFGKDGKHFTDGNYLPAWTSCSCRYQVLGKWPESLWKQYKISNKTYEELLFLCRDGVVPRKRNLDACLKHEQQVRTDEVVADRVKRIHANQEIYQPFPRVPEADAWLQHFTKDALRYPMLLVRGPSRTGKTEWAKSLFKQPLEVKVGILEVFPDGLRKFRRGYHDGIVLDDIRDLRFLVAHQEKLQGKYTPVEFGSTQGGMYAYQLDLFAIPIVATFNGSTASQHLLDSDDFLANPGNRVLVSWPLAGAAASCSG